MSKRDAAVATRRFGLGPRPGEIARIASDPRGAVLAQLARPETARLDRPELESSHSAFVIVQALEREKRLARAANKEKAQDRAKANSAPPAAMDGGRPAEEMAGTKPAAGAARVAGAEPASEPGVPPRRQIAREEAIARAEQAAATETPFLERLVYFWSNHFCVSTTKGGYVAVLAGSYEREVIRPHVLGRFGDMLLAAEQHPCMLIYLDNHNSIGPNSVAGRRRERGLNENLAREILELHTLGVDGGYTQEDVTNLARLITGWTVGGHSNEPFEPGKFVFVPQRHEPGTWRVVGKSYGGNGRAGGEAALADLARHPSTARHIATKLARHFIAEKPPEAVVERLRRAFLDTGGDLAAVTRALLLSEEAWQAPPVKMTPPFDFVVGLQRSLDFKVQPFELIRLSHALGQPLWRPPSPKGWPDSDDAWMGPSALRERLRVAERVATRTSRGDDPRAVAEDLLGGIMTDEVRQAVARAETREQAMQLTIMAPEFQRR
jgi:uncharacterized protein (DUF1800 family)